MVASTESGLSLMAFVISNIYDVFVWPCLGTVDGLGKAEGIGSRVYHVLVM